MRSILANVLGAAGVATWVTAISLGATKLLRYENTAGAAAQAPVMWPAAVHVMRDTELPTLVMFLHPQCPCSKASVGELARVMTQCAGKVDAMVLMVRPDGEPEGWEKTGLWNDAAVIPGVKVASDVDGAESLRFGASTSGQVLLYDRGGRLIFKGGITESRGHSGDNDGESAVESLVLGGDEMSGVRSMEGRVVSAPVYGCALLNKPAVLMTPGSDMCRQ